MAANSSTRISIATNANPRYSCLRHDGALAPFPSLKRQGCTLHSVISGTGKLTKSELVADKLPGFFRLFDRGNGPPPTVRVKAKGNDLALIFYGDDIFDASPPQAIWHYNLDYKTTQLTYKLDR